MINRSQNIVASMGLVLSKPPRCLAQLGIGLLSLFFFQYGFAAVSPWVTLDISNGHLRFDTEISGVRGKSIIDTGASINSINRRFLNKHSLVFKKKGKVRITGVYDTADHPTYKEIQGKIFGVDLAFRNLVETSFGPPEIQLLLGAGFLSEFIFQFDYPNSRMRVLTRDTLNLKKEANLQSKRDPGSGLPIVKVELNDERKVWLVLDTGNSGGLLLERNLASGQKWLDRFPVKQSFGYGINAGAEMEQFNLPSITFGPFRLENSLVSVPATSKPLEIFKKRSRAGSRVQRRPGKAQGLLGFDVLKHFVLTIDYKTGRAHIAQPEPLVKP